MVASRRLSELVESTTSRLDMPDGSVTVALSGGADSAALAYLAVACGRDTGLIHIHHGLCASDDLAAAAERIARVLEVDLRCVRVRVEAGPSPEERAREARYGALIEVSGPVLTAHTRDDTVETMLINMIRGSGIAGIAGIPPHRAPNIYRPMLAVTRSETREIAALAGLGFIDDPMNDDMRLTRNQIRRRIMPLLRDLNPQVEAAMARLAAGLTVDAAHLEELAESVVVSGDMPSAVVITLPKAVADRVLLRWLRERGVPISAELLGRVWSVASGETDRQDLAGGRAVVRRGPMLTLV